MASNSVPKCPCYKCGQAEEKGVLLEPVAFRLEDGLIEYRYECVVGGCHYAKTPQEGIAEAPDMPSL